MPEIPFFFDADQETINQEFNSLGLPVFRIKQIWRAFYFNLIESPNQISTISKDLRTLLNQKYEFSHLKSLHQIESSDHETIKMLFLLPNGKTIESVLMHYDKRQTLCISSQAGCAMGCRFCATGQMGFSCNLSSGEIIEQILFFARLLKKENKVVTNVVIMGMGEPFLNYDAVLSAIERLNDPSGFNLGMRHFTISTVGVIPMIQRFATEKRQINLAVSLHGANDTLRSSLLPINQKYPLKELIPVCRKYVDTTKRRLTFEWALIQGVNDSEKDALELASLVKGMICHVNIIRLNPTENYNGKSTSQERAIAFRSILETRGIPCTIRLRRGIDIQAGCGQLATKFQKFA
ncbi:MAG: 23S rRNA (adenine(2503)-C(2))-methyltransferase RlmN [Chloroflexi bacterium]|nr:23S rRNA (adenine(2503)-C(2))-methyltransferase RlmN [Chloroflexota bacterium]